uniref:Cyclin D-type binding-protein 1 n=1 Tax=Poecilia reticulata TaxID=8081 RepID=A0A3P9NY26_POERE
MSLFLLFSLLPFSLTQEQITSTRGVWSACDRFARLPKDNKEALLVVLSSQSGVVKDAVEKIKQILTEPEDPFKDCLINDPDDNSDQDGPPNNQRMALSEKDQQVITACLEVFETAAACLRKLRSAVEDNSDAAEPQKVAQLDDLADISREISGSVDDLALCLYPPMNYTGHVVFNPALKWFVSGKCCCFSDDSFDLCSPSRSSHVCGEAELTWVQFLEGAVDHDVQKAKELIELDGGSILPCVK